MEYGNLWVNGLDGRAGHATIFSFATTTLRQRNRASRTREQNRQTLRWRCLNGVAILNIVILHWPTTLRIDTWSRCRVPSSAWQSTWAPTTQSLTYVPLDQEETGDGDQNGMDNSNEELLVLLNNLPEKRRRVLEVVWRHKITALSQAKLNTKTIFVVGFNKAQLSNTVWLSWARYKNKWIPK